MEVPVFTAEAVSEANPALTMPTPGACTATQLPLYNHTQTFPLVWLGEKANIKINSWYHG